MGNLGALKSPPISQWIWELAAGFFTTAVVAISALKDARKYTEAPLKEMLMASLFALRKFLKANY